MPATDEKVQRHRGIDYSSEDADGNVTSLSYTAGVTGTVQIIAGSQWNTINVVLNNGNIMQYLHSSEIDVHDGQLVFPDTVMGKTGNVGLPASAGIHLHVQAKDKNGNYMNPNCAENDAPQ